MSKPVAVLKTVEDSPPQLDRRLVEAYIRTIYRVLDPAFDIRIGAADPLLEQWLTQHGFDGYAFVTAWNPASQLLSRQANEARHAALYQALRGFTSADPHLAEHHGESGGWPMEKSWWTPGLAPENAVDLARQFGQNALVFGRKGGVAELWWVAEP